MPDPSLQSEGPQLCASPPVESCPPLSDNAAKNWQRTQRPNFPLELLEPR